jgi:hypothetical protein
VKAAMELTGLSPQYSPYFQRSKWRTLSPLYGPARFLLSNLSPRMSTHHSYLPSFAVSSPQGASGQAVQNFNVMFGYPETTGLLSPPMFP